MRRKWMAAAVVGLLSVCTARTAFAQEIVWGPDESEGGAGNYFVNWDGARQRLIAYRAEDKPSMWGVKAISGTGSKVAIYPLRDFPDANSVDVWTAAGAPKGDIVIYAILWKDRRGKRARGYRDCSLMMPMER